MTSPRPLLAPLALVVLWSSGFVGAELGARAGADPVTLLAWRFALLAALLLAVQVARRRPLPGLRAWGRQAVLALLCQVGYLTLVFEGVARGVPGGTSALIAALQPLLVAAVAGPLLGERTSSRARVGLVLGLVGVALAVSGDLGSGGAPAWAYALPVAGMLCISGGTVLERRLRPPEDLLTTITLQSVVVAVALMLLAVGTGRAAPPASVDFWTTVLWLLVLASLGGYGMYVHVARTRGATAVSTLLYLTPPATTLWVLVMFGEPVTAYGAAGLLVSGLGVALVLARGRGATDPGLAHGRREELAGVHD